MEAVSSPPARSLQPGFPAFLLVPPPTQTALTLQAHWAAIFYHSSFSKGFTRRCNSWLSSERASERNDCRAFFFIRWPDKAPSPNVEAFLHVSSRFSGWAGVQPCSGSWGASPVAGPNDVKSQGNNSNTVPRREEHGQFA